MGLALLHLRAQSSAGLAIQNALIEVRTSDGVTVLTLKDRAGSPLSNPVVTPASGLVDVYLDTAQSVQCVLKDNGHTAYYADDPSVTLTFSDVTSYDFAAQSPEDDASDESTLSSDIASTTADLATHVGDTAAHAAGYTNYPTPFIIDAKSGNDGNPGTAGSPKQTLNSILGNLQGADSEVPYAARVSLGVAAIQAGTVPTWPDQKFVIPTYQTMKQGTRLRMPNGTAGASAVACGCVIVNDPSNPGGTPLFMVNGDCEVHGGVVINTAPNGDGVGLVSPDLAPQNAHVFGLHAYACTRDGYSCLGNALDESSVEQAWSWWNGRHGFHIGPGSNGTSPNWFHLKECRALYNSGWACNIELDRSLDTDSDSLNTITLEGFRHSAGYTPAVAGDSGGIRILGGHSVVIKGGGCEYVDTSMLRGAGPAVKVRQATNGTGSLNSFAQGVLLGGGYWFHGSSIASVAKGDPADYAANQGIWMDIDQCIGFTAKDWLGNLGGTATTTNPLVYLGSNAYFSRIDFFNVYTTRGTRITDPTLLVGGPGSTINGNHGYYVNSTGVVTKWGDWTGF